MPKPVQSSSYTFRDIIDGGFVYVDKTQYLYELMRHGKGLYFLSRPRRFGKSLMISTLNEIFEGNRELFKGLWINQCDYEWRKYPIIRIDFGQESVQTDVELEDALNSFLDEIAAHYDIALKEAPYQRRFRWLIQQLAEQGDGKVVILIDEYDKPILDNITNLAEAQKIREVLRNFYGVIKAMDHHMRFVMLTGISKFSKVGVFSVMNNLDDLSVYPAYASMLGITEEELSLYFAEHVEVLAEYEGVSVSELREKIRHWYDGFCFVQRCESVYNPSSLIQLLNKKLFANYWFETGTPTFLINLIKENEYNIEPFDELKVPAMSFSTYEIENLDLLPLLFQTGYLTIKDFERDVLGDTFILSYPNYEVKSAFLNYLLSAYNETEIALSSGYLHQLLHALRSADLDEFFKVLNVLFANIDYDVQLKHEKYYQTVFLLIFKLMGLQVNAEVKTNQGRIDAVVEMSERIFIFEFKLDGTAQEALQQIHQTEYAEKYQLRDKPITLIGANFDSTKRKVADWVRS